MFILGHLGFGNKLASPWSRRLPKIPLFLGMLLPDIIDKTLFYTKAFPHWVTCTRTFGHTGLFLFSILILSRLFRSRALGAVALGVATHLLLDCLMDRFFNTMEESSALVALGWPIFRAQFSAYHFASFHDHLRHLHNLGILSTEIIGACILCWDYWKSAYRDEMLAVLFSKRWRKLRRNRVERG